MPGEDHFNIQTRIDKWKKLFPLQTGVLPENPVLLCCKPILSVLIFFLQGLVLLEPVNKPYCCMEFEADVFLLFHTTAISRRFQATVHIGNVIQTAMIIGLSKVGAT